MENNMRKNILENGSQHSNGLQMDLGLPVIFFIVCKLPFFCLEFYCLLSLLAPWMLELTHIESFYVGGSIN